MLLFEILCPEPFSLSKLPALPHGAIALETLELDALKLELFGIRPASVAELESTFTLPAPFDFILSRAFVGVLRAEAGVAVEMTIVNILSCLGKTGTRQGALRTCLPLTQADGHSLEPKPRDNAGMLEGEEEEEEEEEEEGEEEDKEVDYEEDFAGEAAADPVASADGSDGEDACCYEGEDAGGEGAADDQSTALL